MKIVLEKATEEFIKKLETSGGAPIYKLTPEQARDTLEKVQSSPIDLKKVHIEEKKIPGGPKGDICLHIYRPNASTEKLPAMMFIHGAGWVMGSQSTHDHLVRELVVGAHMAAIFVDYSRAPEAKFPVAIEEAYTVLKYITEHGDSLHIDVKKLAIVGDSVGGNMSIATTLLAKERHGPKITCQVLFYPVTSADFTSASYQQFADGPWLTKAAMQWFWNAYAPDKILKKNHLISPLHATLEQLKGLPSALIITAENDVLRDEGEQYALKLMQAGVEVSATRVLGTIHDFVMLHALAHNPSTKTAILLAVNYLKKAFGSHDS